MRTLSATSRIRFATFTRHHAPQHQEIAEVVEIGVVGDGVAEPDADGFVDLARAAVARRHQLLYPLEFGGQRRLRWKMDARRLEQSPRSLLREVLDAHAAVAGPLIGGRILAVIHGHECQLVQPGGDSAVRRDKPGGQAAAHGDAEDGVVAERHRSGQRRHLAIVHHFEGDAAPGRL